MRALCQEMKQTSDPKRWDQREEQNWARIGSYNLVPCKVNKGGEIRIEYVNKVNNRGSDFLTA